MVHSDRDASIQIIIMHNISQIIGLNIDFHNFWAKFRPVSRPPPPPAAAPPLNLIISSTSRPNSAITPPDAPTTWLATPTNLEGGGEAKNLNVVPLVRSPLPGRFVVAFVVALKPRKTTGGPPGNSFCNSHGTFLRLP